MRSCGSIPMPSEPTNDAAGLPRRNADSNARRQLAEHLSHFCVDMRERKRMLRLLVDDVPWLKAHGEAVRRCHAHALTGLCPSRRSGKFKQEVETFIQVDSYCYLPRLRGNHTHGKCKPFNLKKHRLTLWRLQLGEPSSVLPRPGGTATMATRHVPRIAVGPPTGSSGNATVTTFLICGLWDVLSFAPRSCKPLGAA